MVIKNTKQKILPKTLSSPVAFNTQTCQFSFTSMAWGSGRLGMSVPLDQRFAGWELSRLCPSEALPEAVSAFRECQGPAGQTEETLVQLGPGAAGRKFVNAQSVDSGEGEEEKEEKGREGEGEERRWCKEREKGKKEEKEERHKI
jgi:hypothetical protein